MQICWSLLCCTLLQAAYYVDILVVSLLHNIVGRVLCRYLSDYFAAQYCRQRTIQIPWSLLCCTILQTTYYVDILVITLLHNIVGSVQCSYVGRYFCCTILQTAYYLDILVVTLLHNSVDSVLCRYLGHYFAAQYCRQRTMSISWSLLYCTILLEVYYVDNLVVTLLHNTVGSVLCRYLGSSILCRYLGRYFAAQYYRQRTMQIICRYFATQYCRQRNMQISWLLLCCTIMQVAYYVDILVITLLHNTVCSVKCSYLGHYFAAQYCRQCSMQISWSLLCCTILQTEYYVDM